MTPNKLTDAEQDADGRIWAIPERAEAPLLRHEGQDWRAAPLPAADLGDAYFLNRRHDGHILAFWSGAGNFTITEHAANECHVVARFGRPINAYLRIQVFVDSRENIWLTEMQGQITRITPTGDLSVHYRPPAEMLFNPWKGNVTTETDFNPVLATEDGAGKIWFWSFTKDTQRSYTTLRGLLVFDGHKFIHHPRIPGLPSDARFSVLAPKDPRHLWLGVNKSFGEKPTPGRLLTLDTKTLALTPAPEPTPGAFDSVEQIITGPPNTYVIATPFRGRALWRLQGHTWENIIPELDRSGRRDRPWQHPYVLTAAGLLIGHTLQGPSFLPRDGGPPATLDWHSGFAPTRVRRMFVTPDEQIFTLSEGGRWSLGPVILPPRPAANPRVRTLRPTGPLFFDQRGHGWGVLDAKKRELNEWDGAHWVAHPFPAELAGRDLVCTSDSLQRSWLRTSENNQPVAFFDAALDAWQTFPSFSAALEHEQARRPVFPSQPVGFYEPIYGPKGQICYLTGEWKLAYFDGTWHFWSRRDIKGDDRPFLNALAFERTGQLRVNAEGETWYYTPGQRWQHGPYRPEPNQPDAVEPVSLPWEWSHREPDSQAIDHEKTLWFTLGGQLYQYRDERVRPAFEPGEPNPFLDGRPLRSAYVDADGQAFFQTYAEGKLEYVCLAPRLPRPQTIIAPPIIAEDCVTLSFTTAPPKPAQLQWRIDDGPWQPIAEHTPITLDTLANGSHRVEATAINQELRPEKTPAVLTFTLHTDLPALTQQRLQLLLKGSADERKQVFAGLVRRPVISAPILRSIRNSADDDQRWWIDAALQEIERQQAKERAAAH